MTLALLAAVGGALLVATDTLWAAALVAFFGMLNTQGSDRGAAQALEQAILPATTTDADRTQVFARYNAIADVGGAAGALLAALPACCAIACTCPSCLRTTLPCWCMQR